MKKFLFLLLAVGSLFVTSQSYGQAGKFTMLSTFGNATDTVTNTGTNTLTIANNGYEKTIAIQLNVTNISGTTAGTATLQASIDGVSFFNIPGVSTATISATALGCVFFVVDSPFPFYRVSVTGSGTVQETLSGFLVARKLNP